MEDHPFGTTRILELRNFYESDRYKQIISGEDLCLLKPE